MKSRKTKASDGKQKHISKTDRADPYSKDYLVRANNNEFGRAGKAGQLIRMAFSSFLAAIYDPSLAVRLSTELLRILKTDGISDRGQRSLDRAALHELTGFECNKKTGFGRITGIPVTSSVDRLTGQCTLELAAFYPGSDVRVPQGATHAGMMAGAAAFNFEQHTYSADYCMSAAIPLREGKVPATGLSLMIAPNGISPILFAWGICFFIFVNGKFYPCTATNNAVAIVGVDMPAAS